MEKYPNRLISIHNLATNLPQQGAISGLILNGNYLSGVGVCHNGDVYMYNYFDDKLFRGRVDYILNNFPETQ